MQYLKNIFHITFLGIFVVSSAFAASGAAEETAAAKVYRNLQAKIEMGGYSVETDTLVEALNEMAIPAKGSSNGLDGDAEKEIAEYLKALGKYDDAAVWYMDAYRKNPSLQHEMDAYLAIITKEVGKDIGDLILKGEDKEVGSILIDYWQKAKVWVSELSENTAKDKDTAIGHKRSRKEVKSAAKPSAGAGGRSSDGFGHMVYKAGDIAKGFRRIRNSADNEFTHMKLQKLLSVAQACHLAVYGFPLFEEDVEAWKFGPVVSNVYHAYKQYEDKVIPVLPGDATDIKDPHVQQFLQRIYEIYGRLGAWRLSVISHEDPAWKATGKDQVIKHELMQHFFKQNNAEIIAQFADLALQQPPKSKPRMEDAESATGGSAGSAAAAGAGASTA